MKPYDGQRTQCGEWSAERESFALLDEMGQQIGWLDSGVPGQWGRLEVFKTIDWFSWEPEQRST